VDVKGKILLQISNKSKLRNGTKTFLKKLGFSAPLIVIWYFCIHFCKYQKIPKKTEN